MLAPEGVRGLLHALQRCVQQQNLNASCGVLRRLVSEAPIPENEHHCFEADLARSSSSPDATRNILDHPAVTGALQLASRAVRDNFSSPSLRPASYAILAHVAQRRQDWQRALGFASCLGTPPAPVFLSTLITQKNWRPLNEYCIGKGWQWNIPVALERLGSLGAWQDALQLAFEIERAHPMHSQCYSLGVLVPLLAHRSSDWSKALRMFQYGFTHGSLVDVDLLAAITRGCVAAGRWQVSLAVASMLHQTHQLHEPSIMNTSVVRKVVQQCPRWDLSLALCAHAHEVGISIDARTVETVLAVCDRQGAWVEAAAVFRWAMANGVLEKHLDGLDSYKAVIRAFHHTARWEQAMEAISWMGHCSEAAVTSGLVEMVELSERSGQWELALQAGAQLCLGSVAHRPVLSSSTYLSLHYACATGGQWSTSLSLYQQQLMSHLATPHPLAACSVLQACHVAKAWHQGLALFALLQASKPRVVVPPLAHALTMKICVDSRRWIDALQLLEHMQLDGLPLDNHGQRLGMWASALCGSWQQSLRHYHAIPRHGRTALDSLIVRKATDHSGPLAKAVVMRQLRTSSS